jgi:hypothetical protein
MGISPNKREELYAVVVQTVVRTGQHPAGVLSVLDFHNLTGIAKRPILQKMVDGNYVHNMHYDSPSGGIQLTKLNKPKIHGANMSILLRSQGLFALASAFGCREFADFLHSFLQRLVGNYRTMLQEWTNFSNEHRQEKQKRSMAYRERSVTLEYLANCETEEKSKNAAFNMRMQSDRALYQKVMFKGHGSGRSAIAAVRGLPKGMFKKPVAPELSPLGNAMDGMVKARERQRLQQHRDEILALPGNQPAAGFQNLLLIVNLFVCVLLFSFLFTRRPCFSDSPDARDYGQECGGVCTSATDGE